MYLKLFISFLTKFSKLLTPFTTSITIFKPKLLGVFTYKVQIFSLVSILYRVYFYSYILICFYVCILNYLFYVFFLNHFFFLFIIFLYFCLFILFCHIRSDRLVNRTNFKNLPFSVFTPFIIFFFLVIGFSVFYFLQFFLFYF